MNEELNKKLAEWAGFEVFEYMDGYRIGWYVKGKYLTRKGYNFTHSLDACDKWLVPKLKSWRIANYPSGQMGKYGLIRAFVTTGDWSGMAEAENPALALCKAIEKLIDSQ